MTTNWKTLEGIAQMFVDLRALRLGMLGTSMCNKGLCWCGSEEIKECSYPPCAAAAKAIQDADDHYGKVTT